MAPSEVLPSTPSTGRVAMASLRGYRQGGHTLALGVALDVASRTLDRVSRPTTPRATSDVASRSTMPRAPSDRASRSTIPRTPLGWVSRSTTPRTPSGLSPASSLAAPAEPTRRRSLPLRRSPPHGTAPRRKLRDFPLPGAAGGGPLAYAPHTPGLGVALVHAAHNLRQGAAPSYAQQSLGQGPALDADARRAAAGAAGAPGAGAAGGHIRGHAEATTLGTAGRLGPRPAGTPGPRPRAPRARRTPCRPPPTRTEPQLEPLARRRSEQRQDTWLRSCLSQLDSAQLTV